MELREVIDTERSEKREQQAAIELARSEEAKEKLQRYYQIPEDDASVKDIQKLSDLITSQVEKILGNSKEPLTLERVQVADALINLLNKYRGARSGVAIASKFNYGLFND